MKTNSAAICLCAAVALLAASASAKAVPVDEGQPAAAAEMGDATSAGRSSPIPEPAAALLGAIGVMMLLRRRR